MPLPQFAHPPPRKCLGKGRRIFLTVTLVNVKNQLRCSPCCSEHIFKFLKLTFFLIHSSSLPKRCFLQPFHFPEAREPKYTPWCILSPRTEKEWHRDPALSKAGTVGFSDEPESCYTGCPNKRRSGHKSKSSSTSKGRTRLVISHLQTSVSSPPTWKKHHKGLSNLAFWGYNT